MYEASSESELDPDVQLYNPEISEEDTLAKLKTILKHVAESSPFYQKKFEEANVDIEKIRSLEDLKLLPFTYKEELRDAYPLGLKAVSENEVIRIHSSSGDYRKTCNYPLHPKRCGYLGLDDDALLHDGRTYQPGQDSDYSRVRALDSRNRVSARG